MGQTLQEKMIQMPNERVKQIPKSINVSKTDNGYLVSPSGIYFEDLIAAICFAKKQLLSV